MIESTHETGANEAFAINVHATSLFPADIKNFFSSLDSVRSKILQQFGVLTYTGVKFGTSSRNITYHYDGLKIICITLILRRRHVMFTYPTFSTYKRSAHSLCTILHL